MVKKVYLPSMVYVLANNNKYLTYRNATKRNKIYAFAFTQIMLLIIKCTLTLRNLFLYIISVY